MARKAVLLRAPGHVADNDHDQQTDVNQPSRPGRLTDAVITARPPAVVYTVDSES